MTGEARFFHIAPDGGFAPLPTLFIGRYEVDGMTLIVSRGTGTWGPRLRLWHPAEILRVTLRPGA